MRDALILILISLCGVGAHSQESATSDAKTRLAAAIDRTLAEGHSMALPPHVSHLLGISPDEQEVPVKQAVIMGEPIRGFEVSTAVPDNIVIFVESRAKNESTYYLMSRRGTLRKVLAVIKGTGYSRVPTKDDKLAFETEKQWWLDHLVPKHP